MTFTGCQDHGQNNLTGFLTFMLLALVVAAVMSGCTAPGPKLPEAGEPASLEGALRAEAADEYILAARLYTNLADTAPAPEKADLITRAAAALIKGGQLDEAARLLKRVRATKRQPNLLARQLTLYAKIASLEGDNKKAARLLGRANKIRNLNPEVLLEIYEMKAEVELSLENPVGAVKYLIKRERLITDANAIDANQLKIWEIISQLPVRRLRDANNLTRDPVLRGWTELAIMQAKSPGNFGRQLGNWKKQHPQHPITKTTLATLRSPGTEMIGRISKIAVLLPLDSLNAGVRRAAEAVKAGIVAMADADSRPDKPVVRFYATSDEARKTSTLYELAKKEGADFIIGPLGTDAVDTLVANIEIDLPTLFLSHTSREIDAANVAVFQFGLTPEQEAKQAAERAYVDGHRNASILFPQTALGERMRHAFNEHWQRLGGSILSEIGYDEDQKDFSLPIQQLLDIDKSLARKERLETITRTRLNMEPRRRQDVGCVFLAAKARHGRLIKPQLNYYRAHDIPIYASSYIFTGRADHIKDADLNGIQFGDMPWLLYDKGDIYNLRLLQGNWPYARTHLDRLYALGMDAYAVIPHLNRISSGAGVRFNGVTSSLSVDQDGRLQRQLSWAKFRRGQPKPLKYDYRYTGQTE